jgi:hypothetical protein
MTPQVTAQNMLTAMLQDGICLEQAIDLITSRLKRERTA